MNQVYLALGTNLGDRMENIKQAIKSLRALDCEIIKISSIYENPPMGFEAETDFYNLVVEIKTNLSIEALFTRIKSIELSSGRIKLNSEIYESRIIDIDIIDFNGEKFVSEKIIVPHQKMHARNFVLIPLNEINPNWVHPINNKSINLLIQELQHGENELKRVVTNV